jgi:hypothetical protein
MVTIVQTLIDLYHAKILLTKIVFYSSSSSFSDQALANVSKESYHRSVILSLLA